MKSLNFIIPLGIYPFDIMVSFGETNEEVTKRLNRFKVTQDDIEAAMFTNETTQGRAAMFSNNASIIRCRHLPKKSKQYAELQHEIFHVVTFIMERVGIELVILKSDEAYAYLIGYITEKIYDKL